MYFKRFYSRDSYFRLSDYDCVGFDLDNTICEYNISSAGRLEYDTLAKFLVNERGYDEKYLFKPLQSNDIDFIQRGLIVDTHRGNLLRLTGDGFIFRASHGSKILNDDDIKKIYGSDRKWFVTTEFARNPIVTWNGPLSRKMRTFSDYFDMPAALALSRCIDSVQDKLGDDVDFYNIWKDVLKGLVDMYNRYNFMQNAGGYFPSVKKNPDLYYNKCRPAVINWLKELKKHKVVFLITGSNIDFASHTASYCIGDNWRDYFDFVVCFSRKPGFFLGGRPFVKLDGFTEIDSVTNDEIQLGEIYSQGNWQGLYLLLSKATGKSKPKCVYIGDNHIQDVFTPSEYTCCDTIAVCEELGAELLQHPSKNILKSDFWGSYFYSDDNIPSLWGNIIMNHSKICVPNLDVLALKSLDYQYSTFSRGTSGYHSSSSSLVFNCKTDKHKVRL
ncbi:5' nucleotidase A [Lycorma delicatula]|uniref:5' nucleotidase A n=1 Tax=Lycorma delicatula TaxID=130591 RepID=UPI003F518807